MGRFVSTVIGTLAAIGISAMKKKNRTIMLGATPMYAFYKVTWPEIKSGVFSGFLMAVTMSLDDFSITFFTKGAGVNTLSTMLYTELRKGVRPELYALSTILFLFAFLLLLPHSLPLVFHREHSPLRGARRSLRPYALHSMCKR